MNYFRNWAALSSHPVKYLSHLQNDNQKDYFPSLSFLYPSYLSFANCSVLANNYISLPYFSAGRLFGSAKTTASDLYDIIPYKNCDTLLFMEFLFRMPVRRSMLLSISSLFKSWKLPNSEAIKNVEISRVSFICNVLVVSKFVTQIKPEIVLLNSRGNNTRLSTLHQAVASGKDIDPCLCVIDKVICQNSTNRMLVRAFFDRIAKYRTGVFIKVC